MNYLLKYCSVHKFGLLTLLIVFLAFILRFYNYEGRWGLAYDQAHDAVVAQHALEAHKIPLVGPFSSAGPFQTGGEWYWIIMLGTALYPNSVIAPWIFLTSISVLFVYVIILVSKELIDKKFGLLIGLLATFSTAQITQSTNLTNQTPLAIIALFSIWMMVRYVKLRKSKYLFFLGILVGLAGTIHLQGVLLLLLPFSLFLFNGKPSARSVGILLIGLLIPLIPLLIFDLQSNFINISSMVQYYLHDQYKISLDVLGRRWLTYAGIFWPKTWGHVIGGNMITGYVLIIGVLLIAFYQFLKKKIKKEWYIMLISFLLAVIVLRYTRTPLFESYVVFLHPLILLLTGWLMYVLYSVKKAFGILFIVIVLIGSANKDINEIVNAENYTSFRVNNWKNKLTSQFPGDKFSLYDYKYKTVDMSLPLVLYLNSDKKIFDKGIKIGMVFATKSGEFNFPLIYGEKTGHQILNLNSLTNKELREEGWTLINPSEVYRTTEDWYK